MTLVFPLASIDIYSVGHQLSFFIVKTDIKDYLFHEILK